ncbi:formate dehydrogenase subunit gamma [Desulfofustis glycolicus]|uniref:Formate dehydrogenase subunit gamma n=1 Tax=Desulfofustis glycolicus DSM 9705 TaxID=1121409 RepID=A0A1M5WDP9_9BACT|nr:formate dehydrogenase subunit gamma [Desulfofustis glycolicus]MCB2217081.1 formate dehydrogenase subunit gamma [Desulfobulbaceae bacterium]SHH85354.1 formate dehydrogenase subunit gamma [Desulfofustis glycolicus DSM 9705]
MAEMVRKSSVDEVLNHWILAGSCILLVITGFAFLFHMESVGGVFGGFDTMKSVHNWAGVVFSVSLLYSMRHYLADALHYDADDRQWFKVAGGYLSHKVKVPPMGKYNPGQKLYYLIILLAGIAIALSGFAIWFMKDNGSIMLLAHLVHNVAFVVFVVVVPVHIYLGTLANPGTFGIMVTGTMPLETAKKRHPKWIS